MDFISKKISNETLGEKFKKAREEKQMDLSKIEEMTKIQIQYLIAIEKGDYQKIPGEIYLKNFLKLYAKTLNLNPEEILKLYQEEQKILPLTFFLKKKVRGKIRLLFISNIFKKSLIGVFLIILLFYIVFEVKNIISPPKLIIQEPSDNLVISESTIRVIGKTDINANVTINNQEIFKNSDGGFNKIINLQSGLNLITISAQKKHSREIIKYRKIMVE
ncbi:helix-turn-helix domain-containing protein [Candidatus Kuenenbacteria bacterium]|nr:helix-turn-helix domain-containing protein [Candidatus Kuenenbacteria bacterium]